MKIIKINDVLYDVVEDDPKEILGCVNCDLFDECPESQSCKCQCVLLADSDHHFERHGKAEKASNAQMALPSFLKTFYYLGKSLDEVVRQYPYVVIIIIFVMNFIISTAMVMQARAERDDYNKQLYETEQKLHNYTVNKE